MALTLGDNFSYQGAKPLDARLTYSTVAAMKAVADATMYNGCMAYCTETDKTYQWKSTNTVDETLGKWREFTSGGGGGGGTSYTAGDGIDITNDVISTKQSETGDIDKIIDRYPTGGELVSIVNAFNKGDLYSADERMIGQWIDGKPLYQKVFPTTATMGTSFTIMIPNTTEYNIAGIVKCVGIRYYPVGTNAMETLPLLAYVDVNASAKPVYCYVYGGAAQFNYIILQYTKTTDQAVSIGDANEYSTSEKIIGTWIDGKPLYQKTFNTTEAFNVNVSSSKTITLISSGVDKIINQNGCVTFSTGQTELIPSVLLGFWEMCIRKTPAGLVNFVIANKDNSAKSFSGYSITLQYTKTT